MVRSRIVRAGTLVTITACLLAACGGDDDASGTSTTVATDTTTTAAPATTTTAAPPTIDESGVATTATTAAPVTTTTSSGGCVSDDPDAPPAGAATEEVDDLDGDGRPDTVWLGDQPDGTRQVGVVTAGGVGTAVQIETGSPVPLSVLVADANETPPTEIFVSDGRTVYLWAFLDCAIQPVTNPEGEQYLFDLGFRGTGTGVGCADVDGDGRMELVGLLAGEPDGDTVPWTRTVIELDGLSARNGPSDSGSFTEPDDDAAIALLHTVSCGARTITADGLHEPQPG
jgi:hypothetical protein